MLIELLRRGTEAGPGRAAVVTATRTLTYEQAVADGMSVASDLRARGIARFGVALEDPVDVVVLLAAASAAGSEACVYPRDLDATETAAFAARLGHDTVITDGGAALDGHTALPFAELGLPDGALPAPDSTPHLILTTGTSGVPKGVRHDWERLVDAVHRTTDPDASEGRWLLAYNLNQFAAFQVLLHAFVHRATVVVPASSHARDVIQTLRDERITHVSATPTFWRLLVGGLEPGLADGLTLRQITLGGEAAPASLIDRLTGTFPNARVSHVYAGTEFGSAVAVGDGQSGLPVSVLDRGEDAGAQFRVVDGELQVRSQYAMLGYHGSADSDGWIATGDLVEERDGRLHFVGRTVEIINVGGAKVHPLPIEDRIATVAGVLVAAVKGAPNAITGQIVAVDVVADAGADRDTVKAAIQAACAELPPPARPRRIRFVDALDVKGQKVIRRNTEVGA